MKQAIAGVTPAESGETTVMVVWPSIAAYGLGRRMGQAFAWKLGFYVFRLGNFIALAAIPVALALYFYRLKPSFFGLPFHGCFYKLTNRRVLVMRNEVHMGPGQRYERVGAGLTLVIAGLAAWCAFQLLFGLEWAVWPATVLGRAATIVSGLLIAGGIVPLASEMVGAPIPMPEFRYGAELRSAELDRFDTISIDRLPGQHWYDAGDLVFRRGDVEVLRLAGVSRPESFRATCWKTHQVYVGVKRVRAAQPVPA